MINTYQFFTRSTAIYPGAKSGSLDALAYLALGLNGEAGEVAEKIKKLLRDGNFDRELMSKELGDVAWYLVRLADELDLRFENILVENRDKLIDRQNRGKIKGEGDTR